MAIIKRRDRSRDGGADRPKPEFDQKMIEIARVTRVVSGGKRMRFRALVVIGNHAGKIGFGLGKGQDVSIAAAKAGKRAEKHLITIPLVKETIPHPVLMKFGSAKVLLKPAPRGSGIIAGGSVRAVLEVSGIPNIVSKMLGSKNKMNNVKATFLALASLRKEKIKTH